MPTNAPQPSLVRLLERVARTIRPRWYERRQVSLLRAERAIATREAIQEHRARRANRRLWDDIELRRFDAAAMTPRTQGWLAPKTPPDAAPATYLDRLRDRARDLSRNNAWAAKAVRAIPAHVVGEGIRATLEHDDEAVAERAQQLWDDWAESTECDADGRTNLVGLQRLAVREVVEAGEVLARMRLRRATDGLAVPLQVQLLEADFLDSTRDNTFGNLFPRDGRMRRQGVEFDQRGRRVGYYLFQSHPALGLGLGESVFIPADTVAHVYRVERAGQVRGVPWGAPCLLTIRDLGDWADATILRAKLAACFAAFVTSDLDPEDPDAEKATPTGKDVEELEPGLVEYLRPGQEVTLTNPPGVEGMEEFPKLTLRAIAMGYGIPVHVLTGDLADVNFSSARIGNLDAGAEFCASRDDWLVPQLLQPIAESWRDQAERAGQIPEGVRFSWSPPPEPLLEPKADLEAAEMRIRLGLGTLPDEQRRRGWRPKQLLAEAKKGWEEVDAAGLKFDSDPRNAKAGAPPPAGAKPNEQNPADPKATPKPAPKAGA